MSTDDQVFHLINTLRYFPLVKGALLATKPKTLAESFSLGKTFSRLYDKQLLPTPRVVESYRQRVENSK